MKEYIHWTKDEINLLLEKYPISTKEELAELFPNRTWKTINSKAKNLKLKKDKDVLQKIKSSCFMKRDNLWTNEENELILQHYSQSGTNILSSLLNNRTPKSITAQAIKLGVQYEEDKWTEDMDIFIINNYRSCRDIYELKMIFNSHFKNNKTYFSINSRLGRLNLNMSSVIKIAKKNEDKIIEMVNDNYSDSEISEFFKCTHKRIGIIRQQNGLLKVDKWNDEEINILINHYPTDTINNLCSRIPNRSWRMIKWKANELNIRRLVSSMSNDLNNKDLHAVWTRAKREEKLYQGTDWFDYEEMNYDEIEFMYNYFDRKCPYCNDDYREITFDHFIPMSKGGKLTINNTLICCGICNSSKQDTYFEEWYSNKQFSSEINKELQVLKIYEYFNIIERFNRSDT